MDLAFVDVETTGLDPQRDTILEIALIVDKEESTWWIEPTPEELGSASTRALQVNNYYSRTMRSRYEGPTDHYVHQWVPKVEDRRETACDIAKATAGCVLAGNTVNFDQQFLEAWMRRHGACPVWDYHIVDVPTFCVGYLSSELDPDDEEYENTLDLLTPPFKSSNIAKALGLPEMDEAVRHTALGDARRAQQMWEAVKS